MPLSCTRNCHTDSLLDSVHLNIRIFQIGNRSIAIVHVGNFRRCTLGFMIDHLTTTTLADHQLRRAEASLHPSDDSRKTSHRPTCTPPDTSPRREHTTHTRSNTVDTVKIDVTRTLHVRAPHQAAAWPASPEPHKPQRAHCGDTCDQACQATVCILLQLVTTRGSAPRTPAAPRLLLLPPTCC